tara:strand:- start:920 stop:1570 length:651 start_codon:yes stop_codon:yes gene_type:complete
MKTKLITLLALVGLSINAASAGEGSASIGYASDYFLRGSLVSGEAVQSSVSYETEVLGLQGSLGASTSQSVASGTDVYIVGGQLSKKLGDFTSVNLGLEHTELVAGDAFLDVRLGASLDTVLSPSVVVERNVDQSLYTFEVGVSQDLDLKVATLGLSALYGNTDQTSTTNVDYYTLGASLQRSISDNASAEFGVDYVDSDTIESESIFSLSLNLNF